MEEKRPKVGIAIIVIKDRTILLGKRLGTHGSGKWAAPGGHLEFFETPESCACRELLEETGLEATRILPGPWANHTFDGDKHYVTLFMIVTEFSGIPQVLEPHKCENWDWFTLDNLPEPLFDTIQSLVETVGLDWLKNFTPMDQFKIGR